MKQLALFACALTACGGGGGGGGGGGDDDGGGTPDAAVTPAALYEPAQTYTVRQVAVENPQAIAAIMTATGKIFRRRSRKAPTERAAAATAVIQPTGSWPAVK